MIRSALLALAAAVVPVVAPAAAPASDDPYLWLEDVDAERSLDWVRARNAVASQELETRPEFETTRARLLAVYDSNERIPDVVQRGAHLYNFWRDAQHPRGLWRRTTMAEFRKSAPAWETVLDLDALSQAESENWVWKGADCRWPEYTRCLLRLSRGGADASVHREFDTVAKAFVKDGFLLPEAKSDVSWIDADTLYVGTDFGPGTLSESGYPRQVRVWKRGTPLSSARLVFEGPASDVGAVAEVHEEPGYRREILRRYLDFFSSAYWLRVGEVQHRLDVPSDAELGFFGPRLLLTLRKPWTIGGQTYAAGSLIAIPFVAFLEGERRFERVFEPRPGVSLTGYSATRNTLLLNLLDRVSGRIEVARVQKGTWTRTPLALPAFGEASAVALDPDRSDAYLLTLENFVTPTSLELGDVDRTARERLKQQPAFFDARGLEVSQHEAVSADGTRVPYFQVSKKGLVLDGRNPTLLYGYGGFEVPLTPGYFGGVGSAWLERGGVYVLANIRGGGEFGPAWHQAALREKRPRAYEDFAAVAENLIARKLTSPPHLGIQGGSNGGLLVGAMFTRRPELFGAVVCQVPLLDMRRYHRLLAGASWMSEYGNPDEPADWAFLSGYSPYQNVKAGVEYPRVLFTTSTRDDRVHPGHARKMAARMLEQGHDVLLYENIEGGHGGAANNRQKAHMDALAYTFLWKQLAP